jgi:hypothetical protein
MYVFETAASYGSSPNGKFTVSGKNAFRGDDIVERSRHERVKWG